MFKRIAARIRRRSWDEHFSWMREFHKKQQKSWLEIAVEKTEWADRWSQHEFAVDLIQALGIPKELNVTWFELRMDWSNDPIVTVRYEHCPEPMVVGENHEIVKVLKKCRLIEKVEEGVEQISPSASDIVYEAERERLEKELMP